MDNIDRRPRRRSPKSRPGAPAVLIGAQGDERDQRRGARVRPRHDQLRDHAAASRRGCRARIRRERRWRGRGRIGSPRGLRRAAPAVEAARSGLRSGGRCVGRRRRRPRRRCWAATSVDVDIAVAGRRSGGTRPRSRAPPDGHPFELSDEFATWRVAAHDGSLERRRRRRCAAARSRTTWRLRDFTVNAIAVPLRRRRADRPDRRRRRSRGGRPAGGSSRLVRRRPAAGAAGGADRGRAAASSPRPGTLELARAVADRAAEPAGERQFAELAALLAGPEPLRGVELLDELGATPACCPSSRRCAGSGRAPTITSTPTATRSRCCDGCSRSSATSSATPATSAGEVAELLAAAAGRRAHPARRASLRGAPARHRQAGDADRSARAGSASSATTRSAPR